jgi:hypothetical protein
MVLLATRNPFTNPTYDVLALNSCLVELILQGFEFLRDSFEFSACCGLSQVILTTSFVGCEESYGGVGFWRVGLGRHFVDFDVA